MPKPQLNTTGVIHSTQVLEVFTALVQQYLPLELQNTRITEEDLWYVLIYASVHGLSLDAASKQLADSPSGNRLREVLVKHLPQLPELQAQLNALLAGELPKVFLRGRGRYHLAIDLTLLPYHGQADESADEVVRGEAQSGTTHFHGYATVSIVHDDRRYVVALRMVTAQDTMATVVTWLLDRLQTLKIRIKRLYLDKGFCAIAVFKVLDARRVAYIVPIPVRGKTGGIRRLFQGRASYRTTYTFTKATETYTVEVMCVMRYCKGRYKGRHGRIWFAYAIARFPHRLKPHQVFDLYRYRFGIETSYRQMGQVRARTSTRKARIRLLLVGLAFAIVNLYIALRQKLTATGQFTQPTWLQLRRLALMLGHAVETIFGVADVICTQPSPLLS